MSKGHLWSMLNELARADYRDVERVEHKAAEEYIRLFISKVSGLSYDEVHQLEHKRICLHESIVRSAQEFLEKQSNYDYLGQVLEDYDDFDQFVWHCLKDADFQIERDIP